MSYYSYRQLLKYKLDKEKMEKSRYAIRDLDPK